MHANEVEPGSDSDLDPVDLNNYKGMFFNDDPGQKYQDPETGAHFEYCDMCAKLKRLQKELHQKIQPEELSEAEHSEDVQDFAHHTFAEQKHNLKVKESGGAVKALQALLLRSKSKESRNAAQALPEQGYGTTEIKNKKKPHGNCARQFSTQLGPSQQLGNQQTIAIQKASRSKSIDKQHTIDQAKPTIIFSKETGKAYSNVLRHNIQKTNNLDKQTILDMYYLSINGSRKKHIENLLEDNSKISIPFRPKTNNRFFYFKKFLEQGHQTMELAELKN